MITVKCPKNVILSVPDRARVVPCPANCPRKDTCELKQFLANKTRGIPQLTVTQEDLNNFLQQSNTSSKTSQTTTNSNTNSNTNTNRPVNRPINNVNNSSNDNNPLNRPINRPISRPMSRPMSNPVNPSSNGQNNAPIENHTNNQSNRTDTTSDLRSRFNFGNTISPTNTSQQPQTNINNNQSTQTNSNLRDRFNFNNESSQTQSTMNQTNSNLQGRFNFSTNNSVNNQSQTVTNVQANSGNEFIELENSHNPIIYIGTVDYYANKYAEANFLPNIDRANIELFNHWNTDVIFDSPYKIAPYYVDVLKLLFREKYQDVVDDVIGYEGDLNAKFYRLFYHHVFKGNKKIISKFYFEEGLRTDYIRSLCDSEQDLYDRIFNDNEYLRKFRNCSKELIDYLGEVSPNSENISSMRGILSKCVKYLNRREKIISHFVVDYDTNMHSFYRLKILAKNSIDFINSLMKIDDIDKMNEKIELLKEYEVLSTGEMIDRNDNFDCEDISGKVDDSIYEILGIYKLNSSQSKDYLKVYLTLAKEYIRIAEPDEVNFGTFKFSVKNFFLEMQDIINRAYAQCTDKRFENNISKDQSNLFLAYVLYTNGVLNYFIERCNTSKIHGLLALLKPTIDYENYITSDIEQKYVYDNNKFVPVYDYIKNLIDRNYPDQLIDILNNDLVFKAMTDNVNVKIEYDKVTNRIATEVNKL